jgi:hypothetical protein
MTEKMMREIKKERREREKKIWVCVK